MDSIIKKDKENNSFMLEVILLKWSIIFLLYLGASVVQVTGMINIIPNIGTLRNSSFAIFVLLPLFLFSIKKGIKQRRQDLISIIILLSICIYNTCTDRDANWGATITSLFMPFMYSFILFGKYAANEKKRQMVAGILIIYFLSNCSLALIERILGFHLFEYSDSMKLGASFRSFAFGGHPLANAVVISTIMNFLWITEISPIKKIQYSVLCFMALFCFNTRFAIVVTAFFFCVFILHLMRERGISFRIKQHVMSICFIMGIVFCFLISYTSFGGRLMNIGLYDDDSAGARLQVLLVFDKYAYSDFIWGMTLDETTELMHSSGIYGVINENPWLIFLFRFGLIFTIIMVTVFFLYFKQIIKGISFYEKSIIVLPMLFIISSFNSIGVDSVALSVWVLCCYAFLPIRNTK